jgi:hypothetical protein
MLERFLATKHSPSAASAVGLMKQLMLLHESPTHPAKPPLEMIYDWLMQTWNLGQQSSAVCWTWPYMNQKCCGAGIGLSGRHVSWASCY